jgi:Methyltransferase domain
METIDFDGYQNLLNGPMGAYYVGRWEYFKVVIDIVNRLKPQSVLELGPGQHTIVKRCDVMLKPEDDAWGRPVNPIGKVILHNATEKPWPVADKQYDLFIALQVWEHLDNKQSRAFREVMRVSRAAILSLPYLWDVPPDSRNYPAHHQIDEELIGDWTLQVPPVEVVRIPRTGPEVSKGPRIIYFWQFQ